MDDLDTLRRAYDRALAGHGPVRAADLLATVPPPRTRRATGTAREVVPEL